ncbi:hypothetical protein K435DRAFT_384623 [Dendrothele bispora CBS 962.96]|uniref:Secreted protein n=1 Tax=Dendrothele bispora (strain CBS 962.96) TaxID=1314807 RepID=A0A4S8LA90_DENBC|nr:hypothetical protein K435DRAFT_384623 [Dendrothele bispora CBS 962.96]
MVLLRSTWTLLVLVDVGRSIPAQTCCYASSNPECSATPHTTRESAFTAQHSPHRGLIDDVPKEIGYFFCGSIGAYRTCDSLRPHSLVHPLFLRVSTLMLHLPFQGPFCLSINSIYIYFVQLCAIYRLIIRTICVNRSSIHPGTNIEVTSKFPKSNCADNALSWTWVCSCSTCECPERASFLLTADNVATTAFDDHS